MRLGFIDDSPRQVGFGTIALVVHSNCAVRPLLERQVVQTLPAFLIIGIPYFLHVRLRELKAPPFAVSEKKHNTISNATTVVDVQCERC